MKPTHLFTAALLVAGGAITTSVLQASDIGSPGTPGITVRSAQETGSTFEKLLAEYESAKAAFKDKLSNADKKERKELRDHAPIDDYWPRFEALAQDGEGRALVWLADNLKTNRSIKSADRPAALLPIYRGLVAHVNQDWFEGALESFARDSRTLGLEATSGLIDSMLEKAEKDAAKAAVLFYGAGAVEKEAPEKAEAMRAQVLADYPGTKFGFMARAATATPEDTEVGKVAPNFPGKSIDGFEFSLEDYRGKVAVLDFYGFW
ncbi:hypothetical protein Poly30_56130 [Planctomycetes bacterium Poly30]|uniref:AhpC/TSA family protein n=1 Tax=Saltatorellus ferox TaxID=2528018 RepID=A0A518F127_9BACT|nr:hypothetical protein Poly30_56130 [Planctomycetes bacterium Poly30]